MPEKRRFERIPETLEITYRRVPDVKACGFITRDISEGGVRFFAKEFLPVGSILRIQVKLKKIYFAFEALAQVKWIKKDTTEERFDVGADFIDISNEAKKRLAEYVKNSLENK